MIFEEPKAEFVSIDLVNITTASSGSIETCDGPDAPMNRCSDEGSNMW